jgi:hypothetical protein
MAKWLCKEFDEEFVIEAATQAEAAVAARIYGGRVIGEVKDDDGQESTAEFSTSR